VRAFVNYRTKDEGSTALAVSQHLCVRLGEQNVFLDSRSIDPGTLFDEAILRGLWRSDVLVAIMGPDWLEFPARADGRAIDDPEDWVRSELVEALTHQVRVVPLLVADAPRPTRDDLPPVLADLVRCQDVRLDLRAPEAAFARLDRILELPADHEPARDSGQSGGIGSVRGNRNIAITDPRGAVTIGDAFHRGDT
jgi:hypothetical protein